MTKGQTIGRRRFLRIAAAAAGLGMVWPGAALGRTQIQTWRGTALGARAAIRLHHSDPAFARDLIARAREEIERLERVFSLYRPDSALSRLNRQGFLDAPPLDLLRLLSEARRYSAMTDGAFDVTVQPLWRLYAAHFWEGAGAVEGPEAAAVAAALARVDALAVALDPARVAFERPGMAVTLNGIAQGYVTDRVAELLRGAGLSDVLIDLGELRALGRHPEGRPWQVGLRDPSDGNRILRRLALGETALATSAGSGTSFDGDGRFHHLLDPRTGLSSNRYLSLSVKAPNATQADALSTGLYHLAPARIADILRSLPGVQAFGVSADGAPHDWPA